MIDNKFIIIIILYPFRLGDFALNLVWFDRADGISLHPRHR